MKTAIVTGSSKGIGKAICLKLLQEGFFVHGISRTSSFQNVTFQHHAIDLNHIKTLPEYLKTLSSTITSLDALICNAGKGLFGSLEELSFKDIASLVDLNFLSQVYLIKTFLPLFKRQERGDIILIGSESSLAGKRKGSLYCATKFALRGFAQALREECSKASVRVTLVNPGMVKTDFFNNLSFAPGNDSCEHLLPEDVAEVIFSILTMRTGSVIEEVLISPQKNKILFKEPV